SVNTRRRCCYLTPRHCKCPGVREPYENKVVRSRVIQAWSGRPGHCGRSLRRRRIRDDLGRLLRRLFRAGPGFRARERPSPAHDARPVDGRLSGGDSRASRAGRDRRCRDPRWRGRRRARQARRGARRQQGRSRPLADRHGALRGREAGHRQRRGIPEHVACGEAALTGSRGRRSRGAQARRARQSDMMASMARNLAIALALLMLVIVGWALLAGTNAVTIVINGQEVTGPLKGAIGIGGLVVALIALVCAAILLAFVFAGIGVIVLGLVVLAGLLLALLAFPFLLPVLIPLAIVWAFVAIVRRPKAAE